MSPRLQAKPTATIAPQTAPPQESGALRMSSGQDQIVKGRGHPCPRASAALYSSSRGHRRPRPLGKVHASALPPSRVLLPSLATLVSTSTFRKLTGRYMDNLERISFAQELLSRARRTPHSPFPTPHSPLRAPHSAFRTPHSPLRTPHSL